MVPIRRLETRAMLQSRKKNVRANDALDGRFVSLDVWKTQVIRNVWANGFHFSRKKIWNPSTLATLNRQRHVRFEGLVQFEV